jgi:integrase
MPSRSLLDASGMRIGELERLTWGDVDEPRRRWRVSTAVAKTGRPRWVQVPDVLFQAVTALVARDDRVAERPVFQGFGADRFRTALARACTAAAVPAFSPHDLGAFRPELQRVLDVTNDAVDEVLAIRARVHLLFGDQTPVGVEATAIGGCLRGYQCRP